MDSHEVDYQIFGEDHPPPGQLTHVPKESPAVVMVPLIMLAIPSIFIGWFAIGPVLFGGWMDDSIFVLDKNNVLADMSHHFQGATAMAMHGIQTPVFWLMMAGFVIATAIYLYRPGVAESVRLRMPVLYRLLDNKYYFDTLYQKIFAEGALKLGQGLWKRADDGLIDGWLVNGSGRVVKWFAARARQLQTGYLYDYAFAMILGLISMLGVWVVLY